MDSCKYTYQGKRYESKEALEKDLIDTEVILKDANKNSLAILDRIKERSKMVEVDKKDGKEGTTYTILSTGKKIKRITDRIGGLLSYFGSKKVNDNFGEHMADIIWQSDSHDIKKKTDKGQMETYDEYKDRMEHQSNLGSIKGRMIHYHLLRAANNAFGLGLKDDDIVAKMINVAAESEGDININSYDWVGVKDTYEKIFRLAGINKFSKETPDILKDIAALPETTVWSDLLNFGGTMDMLIAHADGLFSIIDWKTGMRFNSKITTEMMKYGQQDIHITDNQRERAKLQIMMYAIILKLENPDMKFRDLMAVWIPDQWFAEREDMQRNVEVRSYLEMVKTFLRDPKALKEAGLPLNIYNQMLKKSPKIFDVYEYTNKSTENVFESLINSKFNPEQEYQNRINELSIIINQIRGNRQIQYGELPPNVKKRIAELNEEIAILVGDPSLQLDAVEGEEIGLDKVWFGNYTDVNMGQFQTWVKQRNIATNAYKELHRKDMLKAEQLLMPIYNKYMKNKFKVRVGGIDRIANVNYAELYNFAYKDEMIDGYMRERFVTKDDSEWNKLSIDEKAFLTFINDKIRSHFIGDNALLEQHATTQGGELSIKDGKTEMIGGKNLNLLQYHNLGKAKNDEMKFYDGWFAKVKKTPEEVIYEEGLKVLNRKPGDGEVFGANILGRFSKERMKQEMIQRFSWFNENTFDMMDSKKMAIPVKYLDNPYVLNTRDYTKNVLFMFDNFNKSILHKQFMDPVYNAGQALKAYLELKRYSDGQPMFENTISFLDMKLMQDIQNTIPKSKMTSQPLHVGKYYDPIEKKWVGINLDLDKLGRVFTDWTSATTMWLKPMQGFGNFMHAKTLTYREAAKGTVAEKFFHIDGDLTDIGVEDMIFADKEYSMNFLKDGTIGDINKNKMWLLAKMLDYIPDNYDYATNRRFILSTRNRSVSQSSLYLFHSVGEENISLTTMAAQLHKLKNPVTGKSLWDSYEVVTDPQTKITDLVWKGGIRGYEKTGSGIASQLTPIEGLTAHEIAKLKKVHERMQGGYRKEEAANIELYTVGRMLIQFKKFLPRLVMNAVASKRFEVDLGYYRKLAETRIDPDTGNKLDVYEWTARMNEGRVRTFVYWTMAMSKIGSPEYKWANLSSEQKQNLIDVMLTMVVLFGMSSAYMVMFKDVPDDDPFKKWWWNYMIMNASQQYNPVDMLDNIEKFARPVSLARAFKTTEALLAMSIATGNMALGKDEDTYLTREGDLKGWTGFMRSVPYLASWYDFSSKMKKGTITEDWWTDSWERRWK